jgi:hypothetical protein
MSTEPIYLVTDAGRPVTALGAKDEMKPHLKRRRGTFTRPLVYKIRGDGHERSAMLGRLPDDEAIEAEIDRVRSLGLDELRTRQTAYRGPSW